jgi:PKD repeat protein
MKKVFLSLAVLALLFCTNLSAQDWTQMVKDPKANLHDIQKAFNAWHSLYGPAKIDKHDVDAKKEKEEGEDGNYELFKRWEWFMEQRTYPTGNMPDMVSVTKQYQDYLALHKADEKTHRIEASARWSYAGISNTPTNGEAGRVNRIRIHPTNSNIIYACSPSGGLWKSTNGGTSWSTNTDQLADLGTSDIAINPKNPNIMYLATGDGDGISGGETTPSTVGVLKSTDGGATWNKTSLYYTLEASGPSEMTVNELLINPVNPDTLFAGTSFGLYVTTNGGISWNEVQAGNIKDIAMEPSHPWIVYASTANNQFYRSPNYGFTYKQITLPGSAGAGRLAIAVTPADSNYVYVLGDNSSSAAFQGLWLSTDDGVTFNLQSSSPNLLGFSPNGSDNQGQGWYTLSLAASPTNANEIIVGGVNVWRSTNAGVSWSINASWTGFGAPYIHADIHHLIYLNGTTYFAGDDGGVNKTTNSGASWSDLSNGLEIAEQYSIGLSASSSTLWITGWQDNGTNVANGAAWAEDLGGDGMMCFIDNTNNNNMYGETYQGGFNYSSNGGTSFNNIAIATGESAAWVTPWLQDPKASKTLFAGYENIWKSTNRGSSWTPISTWGVATIDINALAIAPSNDQYLYAASFNAFEGTSNQGATWTNIGGGLPIGTDALTRIVVDPNNPLRLWVTFSGYSPTSKVYQSVNGGTSWTNISNGLPNLPVNCIAYQGNGSDAMYVGTDMGVYYRDTINTGGNWVSYNAGLPNVMIADLKIYAPTNILRAATYGRGTWQIATYTPSAVKPTAFFTAFPTTICANQSVQFTDSSANSPTSWNWTLTGGSPSSSTAQNPTVVYSTAGVYPVKLVATNSHGSDSITQATYVTVNANPPVPTIVQTGHLLTASPSGWAYYQWFDKNILAAGATQYQFYISVPGIYKVVITDSNGCSSSNQLVVSVVTGINSISVDDEVNAYPNPTTGNLQVAFNLPDEGDYTMAVSNILGQTIYSNTIHLSGPQTSSINMANYSKGIYFLSLTGQNSRIVKKITVY